VHFLACAANATSRSSRAEGLDILQALWAILVAGGPFARHLDGGTPSPGETGTSELIEEAISQGRHGIIASGSGAPNIALVFWRLHSMATAREAQLCAGRRAPLDLRWPSSAVCPGCWRRCFRKNRFCWEPWEEQRLVFAAAAQVEAAALAEVAGHDAEGDDLLDASAVAVSPYADGNGEAVPDALPNEDAVAAFLASRCGDWTLEAQ